ncbi:MAG: dual specificity protein phosphatase family protein [Thermodesulfobacteriota bacterium]|nr:dual specificity protein phosphatase family protein [Thermodesulfobacteriota bacterium]
MKVESVKKFLKNCLKSLNIRSCTDKHQLKKDPAYRLTWITDYLAVGHAPMSFVELDSIKKQGINAIINLCAEFDDLHEIEHQSGFEVYYLPVQDENTPDMDDMEKALAWLDEAIYLGKKTLVHCRHGIGRTGTFVTSYLLRRGLGLKVATKKMRDTCATPTNYRQWKLLKKYGKKSKVLKVREPSLEARNVVDLSIYFADYEALIQKIDEDIKKASKTRTNVKICGLESSECCFQYFDLQFIEVIYLSNMMNRILPRSLRTETISKAVMVCKNTRDIKARLGKKGYDPEKDKKALMETYAREKILCPLNRESRCSLFEYRPIRCRLYGVCDNSVDLDDINHHIIDISRNVFLALSGSFLEEKTLSFSLADTVSGKFVQDYFYYLASLQTDR